MKNNNQIALSQFKENSPQHILWKQQFEAATKPNLKQMRWHPTLLRWCIALHAKSPAAYRMIKNSNVLLLPHENTLRDYTHFTSAGAGWNPDVILRAMQDYSIIDDPLKTNISILFDEVKVKSELVYCSETGRLIGFCDLGSINNAIYIFCINETVESDIATHILAIMIRGIFSRLECVVAHYPCKGFNSHQLYWLIWEEIGILELSGFKVRALVCDGATPNRKFYRILSLNNDACHWTKNVYASGDRGIYFICDAPHLMKTTRNKFENSGWNNKTRNLMFNGKPIKWSQVVSIVEQDVHGMGLRLLPKITYKHLHLTPILRMRDKFAVQWLEEDFLGFMDRWEQEGRDQPNLTAKEKKQLCLSRETLEGIRITVKSFVNLAKELLRLPNFRFLLSERFNQDPLEEYFSKQRDMGGRCDNPTVRQFQHNALKLQVAGAPAVMASTRGNCQVRRNESAIATPLQRRKHKSM
ncbi:THAP9 [Mytilus coruscus]|uniref:THAP9 n=1 Tax=Mytilus coruscus TaxID=42192 RepID=A0A6J8DEA6_MYTCO|nr:THAP9 [Mytilus coruscus]